MTAGATDEHSLPLTSLSKKKKIYKKIYIYLKKRFTGWCLVLSGMRLGQREAVC